jgi:hypothetical protein
VQVLVRLGIVIALNTILSFFFSVFCLPALICLFHRPSRVVKPAQLAAPVVSQQAHPVASSAVVGANGTEQQGALMANDGVSVRRFSGTETAISAADPLPAPQQRGEAELTPRTADTMLLTRVALLKKRISQETEGRFVNDQEAVALLKECKVPGSVAEALLEYRQRAATAATTGLDA